MHYFERLFYNWRVCFHSNGAILLIIKQQFESISFVSYCVESILLFHFLPQEVKLISQYLQNDHIELDTSYIQIYTNNKYRRLITKKKDLTIKIMEKNKKNKRLKEEILGVRKSNQILTNRNKTTKHQSRQNHSLI